MTPELLAGLLADGDDELAAWTLSEALLEAPRADVFDGLLAEAMHLVGERWASGQWSVAEEHLASQTVLRALDRIRPTTGPESRIGPLAVLAGVAGEQHMIGLVCLGQVLRERGWTVADLGADVPAEDLEVFLARNEARLVALVPPIRPGPRRRPRRSRRPAAPHPACRSSWAVPWPMRRASPPPSASTGAVGASPPPPTTPRRSARPRPPAGTDPHTMRPGDDQPTALSEVEGSAAAGGPALEAPSEDAEDADALERPIEVARRTGVIFVHGIGNQTPAETFLDWSGPIVELLSDWRTARDGPDAPPPGSPPRIDDPVWRSEFSFNAASPPYLELAIPAHEQLPETTWVLTEAWWAADLRPPDLGRTIDYLRRRMPTLVQGITDGYAARKGPLDVLAERLAVAEPDARAPLDWRLIDGLDRLQTKAFGARVVGWTVGATGALALAGYDALRRIPIGPIQDFAVRKMLDSFLVDWFGDLPILLDDPVQSANVRARLARSIDGLLRDGCDAIVLVAHSGGALVSFETLLDPAYLHLPVAKVITHGQGLGLAWRLATDPDVHEIQPGHRLLGDLARARPGLRWVDVWSSYDPAPAGPLPARAEQPAGLPAGVAVVATGDDAGDPWLLRADVGVDPPPTSAPRIVVENRPVTNEMNVLTDHGTYWANPEGFLIPLVRHLDAALGEATASRFYRDDAARSRRILWRRQRVATLAAWGWSASGVGAATLLVLIVLQLLGDARLARAGNALVAVWDQVPGHQIISAPVEAIGAIVGAMAAAVGLAGLAESAAGLGPILLGVALVVGLFYVMAKSGTGRWHDWDRRERRAMHREDPTLPDRSRALAQAMLLVAGLVAVALAALDLGPAAGLVLVLGTAAGLVIWWRKPFQSPAPPSAARQPASNA